MAGGAIQIQSSTAVLGSSLSRGRFIVCFALLFFLWGLSYGLIDSLNKIPASLFMNRFGYKAGVIAGLSLFSIGAIMFWPCAISELYVGFLVCTFVVGSGLATLEVAAKSYICVLAGQKHASMALTFAQGFNGISGFAGPLIAVKAFFTGSNLTSFGGVQWTYLAINSFGIFLIVLFVVVKFPERCFTSARRCGVVSSNVDEAEAARLFSYCQMTFMAGRFISLPLLHFVYPPAILGIYGVGCFLFAMLTSQVAGNGGMACLFLLFWLESVCYPVVRIGYSSGCTDYAALVRGRGCWLRRGFRLTNGFHFRALGVEEDATLHADIAAVEDHSEKKDGMEHYEDKVGVRPLELNIDPSVTSDDDKKMA
ncbi:hypothetical protein RQP46_010811 [Phenoliferia psychrophenolica]